MSTTIYKAIVHIHNPLPTSKVQAVDNIVCIVHQIRQEMREVVQLIMLYTLAVYEEIVHCPEHRTGIKYLFMASRFVFTLLDLQNSLA